MQEDETKAVSPEEWATKGYPVPPTWERHPSVWNMMSPEDQRLHWWMLLSGGSMSDTSTEEDLRAFILNGGRHPANTEAKEGPCRCPVRPYANPGSFASGSAYEDAGIKRWEAEHGGHPYAKARDTLAKALQIAEGAMYSQPAALDMVADVFGMPRQRWEVRGVTQTPEEAPISTRAIQEALFHSRLDHASALPPHLAAMRRIEAAEVELAALQGKRLDEGDGETVYRRPACLVHISARVAEEAP
jgi:hypothetical protein